MNNKKSTKRALTSSVLSLVLCMAMLIGTTFAWFTDSVQSNNNIIKSGNLDVELEYSTDMATWTPVTSTTNVFKADAQWEPGYTEVVYLRVSNKGSLALKYNLGVNIASETEGVNKDGAKFKLSDYIEYDVIDDVTAKYADRAAARAAVTSASKLSAAYTKEDKISANGTPHVVAMVVYMPESVGNEANHNGTQPVINLGINLYATQQAAESDSFNEKYDEDALYSVADNLYINKDDGSYVALSTEGLSAASKLASSDSSITSVTYVTDEGEVEVPVVTSASALQTASNNKEEIVVVASGDYTVPNTKQGQEITIVGNKDTNINISRDIYPAGNAVSTINFTGVTVNGNGYTNGMAYTKATFTDCIFNTVNTYLYNDTTFISCEFNVAGDYYALWTWGAGTVEFIDCDFFTQGKALYVNANLTSHSTSNKHQDVSITDCRFYDQGDNSITNKAAIEIGDDYGGRVYELVINKTLVDGFAVTEEKTSPNYGGTSLGTNVWGNKYKITTNNLNVIIDGVDVY